MNRKSISITGAALLFFGCFLPAVYLPIVGGMPLVKNGQGDGVLVAILAIIGAATALSGRVGWASVSAWLSLAIIAYDLNEFNKLIGQVPTEDNPFAKLLVNSIRLGEAWAVMFIGIAAMILCSVVGRVKASSNVPAPLPQRRYSNLGFN